MYSYVSGDQLISIIRGGLRKGSGFVEGIDFVFPDLAARAEDEAREDQANRGEGGLRNLEGVPGVFFDLAYRAVDEARADRVAHGEVGVCNMVGILGVWVEDEAT